MPKVKYGKKHSKRRTYRARGGDSGSYTLGSAVAPGAPYAQEVIPGSSCDATNQRFGAISGYVPPHHGGLPGYNGGGKKKCKSATKKYKNILKRVMKSLRSKFGNKTQRGGRWAPDLAATAGGPNPFVPVARLGCEGGTPYTQIPAQSGGTQASQSAYYAAPLGRGPDSAFQQVPNAGYTNQPSSWVSATGTPSLLQVPYEARSMNQACLKTGGGRKKATRKARKKATRKSMWWF